MFTASTCGGKVMFVNTVTRKPAHLQIASVALALIVFGSACGAAAGQQLRAAPGNAAGDSTSSTGEAQTAAGSTSLDYNTAEHLGRLDGGIGATSIDYDTAQHMRGARLTHP
jgi:hypothetical protein